MKYLPSRAVMLAGVLLTILMFAQAQARRVTPEVPPADKTAPDGVVIGAPGRVEPASEEIQVAAQLAGKVTAVLVTEGQAVRRNAVLVTQDQADAVARLDSAKARAAEAAAALEWIVNGARDQERREVSAILEEASAVASMKRAEWSRRRELLAGGVISREEAERSERELQAADGREEAARQRHALVTAAARPEEVRRAAAVLDRARADVAEAQSALDKCVIRSPIDGVVLRTYVRAGESVSGAPDTPVATVADISTLRIRAEVDEADIGRIRLGQPAWASAAAYGDRRFTGQVIRVAQMLGRKKILVDVPAERIDTKVLEVLIALEPGTSLPIGLRVDTFLKVH